MKVGIIGVGHVGRCCATAMFLKETCDDIVLIDRDDEESRARTRGFRDDLSHCGPVCSATRLTAGDYPDLTDAEVVVITAGKNEEAGKNEAAGSAIDPANRWGRQLLLTDNAKTYREILPKVVKATPRAVIIVVTDPPDTLAHVALSVVEAEGGQNPVISSGTYLDSCRFRIQIAARIEDVTKKECSSDSINAFVIGEHGKTQVYVWSSVTVDGTPLAQLIPKDYRGREASKQEADSKKLDAEARFGRDVEANVLDANINIIKATKASQYGIGGVTNRIVKAILDDEGLVEPVGTYQEDFKAVLSLPSVIGKNGVVRVIMPPLAADEERKLRDSAAYILEALMLFDPEHQ